MVLFKGFLPGSIPFLLLAFLGGLFLSQGSRTSRWGRRWLWNLFLLYTGLSMPAISELAAAPLAWGFAPLQTVAEARGAQAIVVLDGGTLRYHSSESLIELPNGSTVMRALEAARVYRLLGEPLVIVSGGGSGRGHHWAPEASALRDFLVKLGVPPRRLVLDSDSQNTRAHALNLVRLLRGRGIFGFVLVTSPTHMRRSILAFRAAGASPIASPSAALPIDTRGWDAFWPSPQGLLLAEQAMHDYFGLVYYQLRGWL